MKGTMTLKQKVFSVLTRWCSKLFRRPNSKKSLTNIEKYLTNQLNKYNIKIYGLVTKEGTLFIKPNR